MRPHVSPHLHITPGTSPSVTIFFESDVGQAGILYCDFEVTLPSMSMHDFARLREENDRTSPTYVLFFIFYSYFFETKLFFSFQGGDGNWAASLPVTSHVGHVAVTSVNQEFKANIH